jgi:molecular chaperone HtpG
MENYNAKAGKHLIEILMFSMYNDQRVIYREYIQNAFDAIYKAVEKGVLPQLKDGIVDVHIDSNAQRIVIRDNGIGIPCSEVAERLLNIADSHKDGVSTAGQHGIGRLTGAGYCKYLKFKTSVKGEDKMSVLSLDVDFAYQIINDATDNSSATEVIDAISKMEVEEEAVDEHYFEVTLEGVKTDYKDLLNSETITEYLKEVAPIDYSVAFKNGVIASSVTNQEDPMYKALYNEIGSVSICINSGSVIRKRYGLVIEGTGDTIEGLDFFKIDTPAGDLLAWGWYALTKFTKQIPVSDRNRGIRLRKHNIQLGGADLLSPYFSESRGNHYFYGEVFAVHPNLRPNSDRSGLAPTPESEIFFDQLRLQFKELSKLYQLANNAKNAVKKIVHATDKLTTGVEPNKQVIDAEKQQGAAEFKKVEQSSVAQSAQAKFVIDLYRNEAPDMLVTNGATPKTEPPSKPVSPTVTPKTPPTQQTLVDILAPLKEKFSDKEIMLIRRVFSYMSQDCPNGSKILLEQLKKKAINKLVSL